MNTPITPEMQGVLSMAAAPTMVDPSSQHRFGELKEQTQRSYDDPFGPGSSPDARAKALRSRFQHISLLGDKAQREDYAAAQNAKFAQKIGAAQLTMPTLVQQGGNSSGTATTSQGGGFWSSLGNGILGGIGAAF